MTTTIKVESLTPFTWDECDFTWDNEVANKSFDEFGCLTYSMTNTETIKVAEQPIVNTGKKLKDSFKAVDGVPTKDVVALKGEGLRILSFLSNKGIKLYIDQLYFNEDVAKHASLRKSASFKLSDKLKKDTLLNKLESVGFSEVYWDVMNFYLKVVENIMLEDAPSKRTQRTLNDNVSIQDKPVKDTKHISKERVGLSDKLLKMLILVENEVLNASDNANKHINKVPTEKISASDSLAKEEYVKISEVAGIVDNLSKYAAFCRNFLEDMTISDTISKMQQKEIEESLTAEDMIANVVEKLTSESLNLSDIPKLTAVYTRLFAETVAFAEIPKKHFYSMQTEQISMLDRFIRACNAILSNIELDAGDMTLEQFENMANKAVGYGVFSDFNVGEYEYQKALVRILVHSNETHSAPLLYGVEHHVDIPDTDDRGTVTITDTTASTKVYYNKHYYTPPEVSITMRGGTEGSGVVIPSIGTTDGKDTLGRYFTVELLNTSGNRVQGTFTWVSKGY